MIYNTTQTNNQINKNPERENFLKKKNIYKYRKIFNNTGNRATSIFALIYYINFKNAFNDYINI